MPTDDLREDDVNDATKIIGEAITQDRVIVRHPDGRCELCGEATETRPYGPDGEDVCFDCGMKDEAAARRAFGEKFGRAMQ